MPFRVLSLSRERGVDLVFTRKFCPTSSRGDSLVKGAIESLSSGLHGWLDACVYTHTCSCSECSSMIPECMLNVRVNSFMNACTLR
jgi:hypothetical protein